MPGGGEDAELLTAAALAVPGVTALHGGRFGEVATYLPGRRIIGVRATVDHVEVHLVVTPDSLPTVTDAVRAAVTPLAGARPVDVVVADLHQPADDRQARPADPAPVDLTATDLTATDLTQAGAAHPVPASDPRPGPGDPPATQERPS